MNRAASPTAPGHAVLAWNSIRFSFPDLWEVTGIRDRYVLLEDSNGPAVDLRWEKTPDRASAQNRLVRLQKKSRRTGLTITGPDPLPAPWRSPRKWHPDKHVDAIPFLWSARDGGGQRIGCLLCFPASAVTVAVRFHRDPVPAGLAEAARLTSSLSPAPLSGPVPWQIYDVAFAVPASFALSTFSLQPGHYRFIFHDGAAQLILDRIGPASVLLQHSSLRKWVTRFHGLHRAASHDIRQPSGEARILEWAAKRKGDPVPPRGVARFLRPIRFCRGRVWLPANGNMLLSVTLSEKNPPPDTLFSEVCSSYVLV